MAVIQTIRNRYGKIAGGIIALALVGFIVSDATSGSLSSLFSGRDTDVMVVDGRKIEPREYNERVKEYETLYLMYNQNGRNSLDDATRAQMSEQLIQMMVYETVAGEQCDKLGITVSAEEEKELVYGMNCDPLIRQFQIEGTPIFNDPQSGQFDPGRIKGFEKEISERGDRIDPTGRIRDQWNSVKNYVMRAARVRKYNLLFSGAAYVPTFQMKKMMQDLQSTASLRYVKIPFTAISDVEAKVTDEDINAYMKKHAPLFTNDEATRSIEYVSFDIIPSSADTARVLNALEEIRPELATTKNYEVFVNGKSDVVNGYTPAYFNSRTLTTRAADTLLAMPVGEIYGPYYENGAYNLVRVTDRKTYPDSVKVRYVMVRSKEGETLVKTDTAASMKIDSAIAMIKGGVKFDSVVNMYSEDEASKQQGGEITFSLLSQPSLPKEFGDFIFEGKSGEAKKIRVANDNYTGYFYIEILEQTNMSPSVQLAMISKTLAPGDSTIDALYGKAVEFAGKNTTTDAFNSAAKKNGYDKRVGENVKINSFNINGLGPAREVVRWMFDKKTQVGTVSDVFQLGEERYVVARLAAISEKGLKKINPVDRPMLEQRVRDEKKAELIANKYKGKSLEAIAAESMQEVHQSDSVILGNAYIPDLGYEPKVVGYAFNNGFQPNTVSPAIKGQSGVFFITVLNRVVNPLPPDGGMMDQVVAQQRMQQERQLKNVMDQQMQQTLIKRADVTYYPSNF